jgi:hypothetical protein
MRSILTACLLAVALAGCAVNSPPEPPRLNRAATIKVDAREAVGDVVPVQIKAGPRSTGPNVAITVTSFTAIKDSGQRVPSLSPQEATIAAGGADKLLAAIADKSTSAMVGEQLVTGPGLGLLAATAGSPLAAVGIVPIATLYGIFNGLRLSVSAQQRLDYFAYDGNKYLPFYESREEGNFIFFPKGRYRSLEARVHLDDSSTGLKSEATITQSWPIASEGCRQYDRKCHAQSNSMKSMLASCLLAVALAGRAGGNAASQYDLEMRRNAMAPALLPVEKTAVAESPLGYETAAANGDQLFSEAVAVMLLEV